MAEETLLGLTLFNRVTFRDSVDFNDVFFLLTRNHRSAFDLILPPRDSRQGKNLTAL
jgi:hypothetical protein